MLVVYVLCIGSHIMFSLSIPSLVTLTNVDLGREITGKGSWLDQCIFGRKQMNEPGHIPECK